MELSNHKAYSSFSGTSCRKRLLSPSLLGDTLEVVLVLLLLLLKELELYRFLSTSN